MTQLHQAEARNKGWRYSTFMNVDKAKIQNLKSDPKNRDFIIIHKINKNEFMINMMIYNINEYFPL